MKRNKLLSFSAKFFALVQAIPVIGFLALTGFLFSYLTKSEYLNNYVLNASERNIEWVSDAEAAVIKAGSVHEILLYEVQPYVIYIIYLKAVLVLLFVWLIVQEFRKVIRSTQQWQTFGVRNVESFQRMGKYFLVVFLLTCFSFFVDGNQVNFTVDLELKFAMLALASFILAEVFKEGSQLQEEQQLTV